MEDHIVDNHVFCIWGNHLPKLENVYENHLNVYNGSVIVLPWYIYFQLTCIQFTSVHVSQGGQ